MAWNLDSVEDSVLFARDLRCRRNLVEERGDDEEDGFGVGGGVGMIFPARGWRDGDQFVWRDVRRWMPGRKTSAGAESGGEMVIAGPVSLRVG